MDNNYNGSPRWAGFRKLWIVVAIILFILLLLLWALGYGPGGKHCNVAPTIVEKEKLVDNPELLTRIGLLEKENQQIALLKTENTQISGLKTSIEGLTKSAGLVAGLQAKVKALEAVDVNFIKSQDDSMLLEKIGKLENDNLAIPTLVSRIKVLETNEPTLTAKISELETENGLIAGLKAKVAALEAVDVNFVKPEDDSELLQKINNLEVENLKISGLNSRIEALQAKEPTYTAKISELENKNLAIPSLVSRIKVLEANEPTLNTKIGMLEKENGLIAGLKAKVAALEAVDVNFVKPKDDSKLLQKINNLEVENLKIPSLNSRIEALQAKEPTYIEKIKELETENLAIPSLVSRIKVLETNEPTLISKIEVLEKENGLIPGLQAKVKALEAVDINFISKTTSATPLPSTAKFFFEPGSSRFPTDTNQSMADVIVYLRANPASTASLVGFHDASGNANWNRRLASRRANRVKQVLIDAGISSSRIVVEQPSQTLGSGLPEEARRVEVEVKN